MPRIYFPPAMRTRVGQPMAEVHGLTVREAIEELETKFPGIRDCICVNDRLIPGLSVVVDGRVSALGLRQPLSPDAEVHFVPALGGG